MIHFSAKNLLVNLLIAPTAMILVLGPAAESQALYEVSKPPAPLIIKVTAPSQTSIAVLFKFRKSQSKEPLLFSEVSIGQKLCKAPRKKTLCLIEDPFPGFSFDAKGVSFSIKVRSKNKHGFSKWSEPIWYHFENGNPVLGMLATSTPSEVPATITETTAYIPPTTAYVPPTTAYAPPSGGGGGGGGFGSNWLGCYFKGQKMWGSVYITSNSWAADFDVYQTSNSWNADLDVYITSNSWGATSCGIWYITTNSWAADFTIYLTQNSWAADFSIYSTSNSWDAGR